MKKTIIFAIIISAIVTLFMDLAIELTADSIKPWFAGREWLVYLILGITFFAAMVISIYLMREQEKETFGGPETGADIEIEDTAASGGKIEDSPIQVNRESKTTIKRSASDKGKIDDSGITIK